MAQITLLVDTLKQLLKARGKTYADVAQALELSEGSVKRLFSNRQFSLARFEQVCQMMDMEISDLVQLMHEQSSQLLQLTPEQEQQIAADRHLILVTVCVLNRWTVEDILAHYDLPRTDLVHHLATLDRMHLIELLPGERIQLLASANFHWIEDGPIQHFFQQHLGKEIFQSRFDRQAEKLAVANLMLSRKSLAVLQKKIDRLIWEAEQLNRDDAGLPVGQRQGSTLVVVARQWQFGLFADLRKN